MTLTAGPTAAAMLVFLAMLPLSIALMNVGGALLWAGLLAVFIRDRRLPWDRSWDLPVAALAVYCVCGLLAAAVSPEPAESLRVASKDLHKLWIFVGALLGFRLAPRARHEAALGLGFTAAALVGIWQAAFLTTGYQAWVRASGFVHAVTYGQQMALAVLGAVCLTLAPSAARRWAAAFLPLGGAALVLSQTRAAILGLAAGALALGLRYQPLRRRLPLIVGATLAGLLVWEMMPGASGNRTLRRLFRPVVEGQAVVDPHQARWVLWDASLAMFEAHPLTGIGPGRFREEFPRYFSGRLDGEGAWGSAHNLYLHQLAERGVLGALGLLAAFGGLGWAAWRRARAGGPWALCGWASLAAFAVMCVTESAFQNEQISALLLTLVAAGLSREP